MTLEGVAPTLRFCLNEGQLLVNDGELGLYLMIL